MINREISIFSLPLTKSEAINNLTTAVEFLEYLKAHKKELASHKFRLSADDAQIDASI
jgi:hypothetical protein